MDDKGEVVMGMFDRVWMTCPGCGHQYEGQSKGGGCTLTDYQLETAPIDVLGAVEKSFICEGCGRACQVEVYLLARVI